MAKNPSRSVWKKSRQAIGRRKSTRPTSSMAQASSTSGPAMQGSLLRPVGGRREIHSLRARRAARLGPSKRILALDARARGRDHHDARRAWHRDGSLQSARQGFSHRHDRPRHEVQPHRHAPHRPALCMRGARRQSAPRCPLTESRRSARSHAGAGRARLASRSEPWIVPLFGTRNFERFEENIGALSVQLTAEDMQELNGSKATMPVQGARYPDEHMRRVGL
jgi:hypothetical protein